MIGAASSSVACLRLDRMTQTLTVGPVPFTILITFAEFEIFYVNHKADIAKTCQVWLISVSGSSLRENLTNVTAVSSFIDLLVVSSFCTKISSVKY